MRIWTSEKKFLREINFPNPVDSVCFLKKRGDILVAHEKRVSVIKLTTYWTKTFDYFGITQSANNPVLKPIAEAEFDATIYDKICCKSDFVIDKTPPKQVLIDSDLEFN